MCCNAPTPAAKPLPCDEPNLPIRDFVQYPDVRLRRRAEPATTIEPAVTSLWADMLETMYAVAGRWADGRKAVARASSNVYCLPVKGLKPEWETVLAKADKSKEPESAMDYPEHERTYEAFLALTKWTVVTVAALLVAMVAGFFWGFGLWGIAIFAILMIAAYFLV